MAWSWISKCSGISTVAYGSETYFIFVYINMNIRRWMSVCVVPKKEEPYTGGTIYWDESCYTQNWRLPRLKTCIIMPFSTPLLRAIIKHFQISSQSQCFGKTRWHHNQPQQNGQALRRTRANQSHLCVPISVQYLTEAHAHHRQKGPWNPWFLRFTYVPWSKVAILGMVIPPFNRNPYNGYINPYYWVDDHPLLYGNNGSLDPGTYCVGCTFFIDMTGLEL